jgi:acetyl-CoA/propionyl-CoA carboxylase biotin carboxyl carrier protein
VRTFDVEVNGRRFNVRVAETGGTEMHTLRGERAAQRRPQLAAQRTPTGREARPASAANGVVSSLQGTVVAVRAQPGQQVEAGQVLFVIEAMKMENEIAAPHAGTLADVRAREGQVVEPGTVLATYRVPG